jgi:muconolactone delta-isomerase
VDFAEPAELIIGRDEDPGVAASNGRQSAGRARSVPHLGKAGHAADEEENVEFLVDMVTTVPEGTTDDEVADIRRREATRAAELTAQGSLLRLWRPPLAPGQWRTWGLFSADGPDQLETVLASMPLRKWRHDTVTPLSPHPSDPGQPAR